MGSINGQLRQRRRLLPLFIFGRSRGEYHDTCRFIRSWVPTISRILIFRYFTTTKIDTSLKKVWVKMVNKPHEKVFKKRMQLINGVGNVPINFFFRKVLSYKDSTDLLILLLRRGHVLDFKNPAKLINRKKKKFLNIRTLASLFFFTKKLNDYVVSRGILRRVRFYLKYRFKKVSLFKRHKIIKMARVPQTYHRLFEPPHRIRRRKKKKKYTKMYRVHHHHLI